VFIERNRFAVDGPVRVRAKECARKYVVIKSPNLLKIERHGSAHLFLGGLFYEEKASLTENANRPGTAWSIGGYPKKVSGKCEIVHAVCKCTNQKVE
jgi:hypothetical protein